MKEAYSSTVRAAIVVVVGSLLFFDSGASKAMAQTNQASELKTICVVVPHFKDEYWLSVGYGLILEAEATGADLLMFESGGYHALRRQIELLDTCIARHADTILLGAVSADDPSLLSAVENTALKVPVVALVNELRSPHLSGAVGVDWTDMGLVIGRYLARAYPETSAMVSAAIVTGPAKSGWSPLLEKGLLSGMKGSSAVIEFIGRSDTGLREQLAQVEAALDQFPELDIIIGSGPAIEGAMGLAANAKPPFPVLVSTYISHSVRRGVQSGVVAAVAFDDPVEQGKMGVRVALSAKTGLFSTTLIGPEIRLIKAQEAEAETLMLAPAALELEIE